MADQMLLERDTRALRERGARELRERDAMPRVAVGNSIGKSGVVSAVPVVSVVPKFVSV